MLPNRVDAELEGTALYKYDRLALAESVIAREEVASPPPDVRYEDPEPGERHWLAPARQWLAVLDDEVIDGLMTRLAA